MLSNSELKVLMSILDKLTASQDGYKYQDLSHRASDLRYTLVSEFGSNAWGRGDCEESEGCTAASYLAKTLLPTGKEFMKPQSDLLARWLVALACEVNESQAISEMEMQLEFRGPSPTENLPEDFVETVKRHALIHLVPSDKNILDVILGVLDNYSNQAISNLEKAGEIIKVTDKIEKVIPLLIRAMETTDDLDLLEASIDLLEIHLARLGELTR